MKKLSAFGLFKKFGYKRTRKDDDYIMYEREIEYGAKKVVTFCEQNQTVHFKFEGLSDRTQHPCMDYELFLAIQAQISELEWEKYYE